MSTILRSLIQFGFDRLYTTFAWSYDVVAAAASLGEWKTWGAAAVDFLPQEVFASAAPLLEIAHGPGHLHAALRDRRTHVFGIDRSPQMGRITRARCHYAANLARADAFALPFVDAHFTAVVCTFPASFIFAARALEEITRVLQPGGRCVIVPYATLRGRDPLSRLVAAAHRLTGGAATHAAIEARVAASFSAAGLRFEAHQVRTPRANVAIWLGSKIGALHVVPRHTNAAGSRAVG